MVDKKRAAAAKQLAIKNQLNKRKTQGHPQPLYGHAREERERFAREGKTAEEYRTYRRGQRAKAHNALVKEHPEWFDANGRPNGTRPPKPSNMEKFPTIRPDKPGQKPPVMTPTPGNLKKKPLNPPPAGNNRLEIPEKRQQQYIPEKRQQLNIPEKPRAFNDALKRAASKIR